MSSLSVDGEKERRSWREQGSGMKHLSSDYDTLNNSFVLHPLFFKNNTITITILDSSIISSSLL